MKKVLMTLIVALAMCGSSFAQYQTYWPGFDYHAFESQGALVAAITIDGQIINVTDANWDALEVAAFVGDELRANEMYLYDGYVIEYGDPFPVLDGLAVFYTTPGETVTIKMYDHLNEVLYETCNVTLLGEPFTILTGDDNMQGWYDPENPIMLNFTTAAPEPEEYIWNVNEPGWTEPDAGANVTIPDNSIVIIPEGCVAIAGEITMGEGSSIIIEEGGELIHTNEVAVTMEMDVPGYSSKDGEPAGYRLIASPVYTDAATYSRPVEGTNLNTGAFDLYLFKEEGDTEGKEWINFEQADNLLSDLYTGRGYLYATAAQNPNIIFVGNTMRTDYTVMKPLEYTNGKRFAGWNLMGNPYTCKAYVTDGGDAIPYYKLNDAGSDLVSVVAGTSIAPLKGIFLQAESADDICVFTTTPPTAKGTLNINLSQDLGTIDNAIINFGEGRNLGKFQLNASHTKVYMTQNGKDYAVLHSGEIGEMPVSFKAENNGTYNLSFTSENVGFNYLHLIDNMTGADVDLLANPSYTFSANTTDYASRFKLVYATGNNTEDNFAFFSNGNLIINNEGAATVQVIDVTGRILSSESINGSASINVNAAAGVYMIRLINGNDVKVQKMVVK